MPRKIVITTDHEIFGNGAGDVRQHVVDPTESMCRIGERHDVPITIFFELEEYLAFEREVEGLNQELGYDPAKLMREQAADLAKRGHDFQLHLYPQWYGATRAGGEWQLDMSKLTVDSLFDSPDETSRYLAARKEALESISGQPVTAYRAGGFAAQPGKNLLEGLKKAGFVVESSVVKGLHRSVPHPLDFRQTPSAGAWRVSEEVTKEDPNGSLWEIPIHSVMRRRLHQLTPQRILAKFSKNVPKEQQKTMVDQLQVGKNPFKMAAFLAQPVPIKLDYHNLSPQTLLRMIKQAPPPLNGDPDVVVAIGHSKEHINDERFEAFVKLLAADPDLEAVTFTDVANMLGGAPRKSSMGVHDQEGETETLSRIAG